MESIPEKKSSTERKRLWRINYRKRYPERIKQSEKSYRNRHREKVRQWDKNYRIRHKDAWQLKDKLYGYKRRGTVFVDIEKLRQAMEDSYVPVVPLGVYTWQTTHGKQQISHTVTYSDDKVEWKLYASGRLAVRKRNIRVLSLISSDETSIVANCHPSEKFGNDMQELANYFIWLVNHVVEQA